MTHNGSPDEYNTPIRATVFEIDSFTAFLILFFLSPLFFRRLGGLAIVGWIIAFLFLLGIGKPQF